EPKWQDEYRRYADAAGVITMNQSSRSRLLELGQPASKIHVIPYGVDVPPQPRYRQPRGTVHIAAVGRMVAKKGPLLTLDAFRQTAQKCGDVIFQYVGDGALLAPAKQFVRDAGLEGKVHFPGSLPNPSVLAVLEAADIFVQHSIADPKTGDQEGLPVAI